MATDRYAKHVLVRCGHPLGQLCPCRRQALAELDARWCADAPDLAAQREQRDRLALARRVPALHPRADHDVLSALGAWACLGLAVALILALVAHHLWRVILG
ncbi:MAG: hypothetical protein ABR559_03200 [Gemmatimonadota bacterium]